MRNATEEVRLEAFGIACAPQYYLARHPRFHLHQPRKRQPYNPKERRAA
ncbi:hypothetical protein [Streptosporangium subroseum]|nr:hypothetical protein [Streptosporangium subroseum]